jgi:hypothetical protein
MNDTTDSTPVADPAPATTPVPAPAIPPAPPTAEAYPDSMIVSFTRSDGASESTGRYRR